MLVAACAVYAQIPNVSGRVTSTDGSPVAGAVVSDGLNCTQTDSDGRYTLTSDLENRHFIMLSVPAEYEIPARHSLPIPFKRIPRYVETFTADFVLEPRKESSDHHTLIVQGDPQIKDFFWDNSAEAYRDVVIPDIIKTRKSIATPCYGIELGDVIYNELTVYPVYLHNTDRVNMVTFNVIGNHDHDKAITVDADADASFEAAFGPTYYSYNIGDCHFVVLDDVLYTGSSSYTADITDEQMAWLEQDLKYVPKDKLIIIGLHIATSRRNRPSSHVADYKELYALLDGYNVRILSGHSHNNYTTTISETIEENTLGAVMGAYWNGEELCNDGSPRGYAVYEIEGNRIRNWYYKGTAFPREYQMYLYGPGEAVSEKYRDGLILNIFNWHTTWTVEVQEDNAGWVTLPSDSNLRYEMDRRAYDFMFGDTKPEHRPTAEPESNNDHMFYYKPASESWGTVTVRASDPYGNVYTESIRNE